MSRLQIRRKKKKNVHKADKADGKAKVIFQKAIEHFFPDLAKIKEYRQELAKKKAEKEKQEERQKAVDTLPETLAALQSAQTDTDTLMVDQEYRLTLLELGVTPEE